MKGHFRGASVIFFGSILGAIKARRLLYTLAQFGQNAGEHHHDARARMHARLHSRWASVFSKLIKTQVTGMVKMFCYQNFGGLNLTADSTVKSGCLGKSGGQYFHKKHQGASFLENNI